jgi:hypothetical protein
VSDLFSFVKPQLDAMRDIYQRAYDEGRRSAFAEMLPTIERLQASVDASHFLNKNEDADPSLKPAGEHHHGPESSQTRNRKAVQTEVPH